MSTSTEVIQDLANREYKYGFFTDVERDDIPRGLSEEEATTMVVSGFIEPLVKELPMEYAVEMNRLIALQMEGSIG